MNTSPASQASPAPDKCVFKYFPGFSGAGEVYLNTSPALSKYILICSLSGAGEAWEVFKNTFPAPEKYLYTLFRRRRSLIYTYLAPERPEKPEKYLYTPVPIDTGYLQLSTTPTRLTQRLYYYCHSVFCEPPRVSVGACSSSY